MDEILMEPNQYGYQVNIAHPQILPLYKRFKVWKRIPESSPMSDEERFEFERYILEKVKKQNGNQ